MESIGVDKLHFSHQMSQGFFLLSCQEVTCPPGHRQVVCLWNTQKFIHAKSCKPNQIDCRVYNMPWSCSLGLSLVDFDVGIVQLSMLHVSIPWVVPHDVWIEFLLAGHPKENRYLSWKTPKAFKVQGSLFQLSFWLTQTLHLPRPKPISTDTAPGVWPWPLRQNGSHGPVQPDGYRLPVLVADVWQSY